MATWGLRGGWRVKLAASAVLAMAASASVVTLPASAHAEAAPAIYTQKCELCHSIAGKGGKKADVGGPLDGVGGKRDEAWLRKYIADPKSAMEGAKMPKFNLAPADMDAVVKYMQSLK